MTDNGAEFLRLLRNKGVKIWHTAGRLRYQARRGLLSADEIARLHAMKPELLRLVERACPGLSLDAPILPREPGELVPLSYRQEARWDAFQLLGMGHNSRSCAYAVRICGALSVACLSNAFDEVVRRHESLRTRIVIVDGVPEQRIDAPTAAHLEVIDLTEIAHGALEAEAQRLVEDLVNEPVDMAVGPAFKARVLTLASHDNVLIAAVDHVVADGSSLDLLIRDLWMAYAQGLHGACLSLPAVHAQMADYAVWQRSTGPAWIEKHGDHWNERLSGTSRLQLPVENIAGEVTASKWIELPICLEAPLRAGLREVSRREHSTLVMTVLATYVAVLLRWCEARETVVGFMTTGRTRPEIENTVGFFASTLYLRVELTARDTFRDLLRRVTEEYLTALAHQDFGLLPLSMRAAQLPGRPNFNWYRSETKPPAARRTGDMAMRARPFPFKRAAREMQGDGDLDIYGGQPWLMLGDTGHVITGCVLYRPVQFRSSTMLQFAQTLRLFARMFSAEPRTRVAACALALGWQFDDNGRMRTRGSTR